MASEQESKHESPALPSPPHPPPRVLESLEEEPLEDVELGRQHVSHRLRQLVQYRECELAVLLRLLLRALPHKFQELLYFPSGLDDWKDGRSSVRGTIYGREGGWAHASVSEK